MGPFVSSYEAKVISIWESDDRRGFVIVVDFVPKLFLHLLQLLKHRVEGHEKNGWTEGIALKNSPAEGEGLGAPGLGLHHGHAVGVEGGHVGADVLRYMIPSKGLHDEVVGDAPKGVL